MLLKLWKNYLSSGTRLNTLDIHNINQIQTDPGRRRNSENIHSKKQFNIRFYGCGRALQTGI